MKESPPRRSRINLTVTEYEHKAINLIAQKSLYGNAAEFIRNIIADYAEIMEEIELAESLRLKSIQGNRKNKQYFQQQSK